MDVFSEGAKKQYEADTIACFYNTEISYIPLFNYKFEVKTILISLNTYLLKKLKSSQTIFIHLCLV